MRNSARFLNALLLAGVASLAAACQPVQIRQSYGYYPSPVYVDSPVIVERRTVMLPAPPVQRTVVISVDDHDRRHHRRHGHDRHRERHDHWGWDRRF